MIQINTCKSWGTPKQVFYHGTGYDRRVSGVLHSGTEKFVLRWGAAPHGQEAKGLKLAAKMHRKPRPKCGTLDVKCAHLVLRKP